MTEIPVSADLVQLSNGRGPFEGKVFVFHRGRLLEHDIHVARVSETFREAFDFPEMNSVSVSSSAGHTVRWWTTSPAAAEAVGQFIERLQVISVDQLYAAGFED